MVNNNKKRLLLLGGGHSHIEVLRQFSQRKSSNVDITLISRDVSSLYTGMLPGYIAGHYTYEDCHINLEPLAQSAGATFVQSEITGLDVEKKTVTCSGSGEFVFDLVSVNTGSIPATRNVEGVDLHAMAVKPPGKFVNQWQALLEELGCPGHAMNIAVVGGGAGGVELVMALKYRDNRLRKDFPVIAPSHQFHLFTDTRTILPTHNTKVQEKVEKILSRQEIRLHPGKRVTDVSSNGLECEDGSGFKMDHILWVTQAAAPGWIKNSELRKDEQGFILVNRYLQSVSHPEVFAAGDVATIKNLNTRKSGVTAVRQGTLLAVNLLRYLSGEPLQLYTPQKHALALISCGSKYAVASRGKLALEGGWLWTLKDWIDRRHIRKYSRIKTGTHRAG